MQKQSCSAAPAQHNENRQSERAIEHYPPADVGKRANSHLLRGSRTGARRKAAAPMSRHASERARRRLEAAAQDLTTGAYELRQLVPQLETAPVTPASEAAQAEALARASRRLRAIADELQQAGRAIAERLTRRGYAPIGGTP